MKAFVLFICSLFALTIGCKGEENKADYRELRDSLAKLVSQGALHNDSAMMLRALSDKDNVLNIIAESLCNVPCDANTAKLSRSSR